jgi:hypothetical protein
VLVRRHLPGFLARLEEAGHALPEFVKAELEGFAVRIPAIVITRIGHRDHPEGVGAERRAGRARRRQARSEATLMECSGLGVDLLAA